jgi:hypothetical protein
MKTLILSLMIALLPFAAHAREVKSEKAEVSIGRVVQLFDLTKPGSETRVSVAVHDLGGSTDMSPTQDVYLTIYREGEMFSTDAAFRIDGVFSVNGAKRRPDGRFEISAKGIRGEKYYADVIYVIDARGAIKALNDVDCGGDFDCGASENFSSSISVIER